MLIQFTVKNFLSFKEEAVISMVAAKDTQFLDKNTFYLFDKINLLKCAAIYGPNASGKSNLLKSLQFFQNLVINSSKETQAKEIIPVESFKLNTDTINKPSLFEIIIFIDGIKYRYGFEVTKKRVVSEWLFSAKTKKESKLFIRNKNQIDLGLKFKEGKKLDEKTRDNALFLSVVAQFNGETSIKIMKWFRKLNIIHKGFDGVTIDILEGKLGIEKKQKLLELLKFADLNIENFKVISNEIKYEDFINKLPKIERESFKTNLKIDQRKPIISIEIKTMHKVFDKNKKLSNFSELDLDNEESNGTKKFFSFAGPIIDTLLSGNVLLIDEIECSLHHLLVLRILELINSKKHNSKNAQFLFTTHDVTLLNSNLFRRDQLLFVDKNSFGESELYSLIDFAKHRIRKDESYEKNYLLGKYGAIPILKDFGTTL